MSRTDVLAVGVGLVLGASFIDFRLLAAPWLGLAGLLALLEGTTPRRAFRIAFVAGLAGLTLAFGWLVYTLRVFGGLPLPVALGVFALPVGWMAVQFGVFGALAAWLGPLPLGLTAPLVFTAVEFLFPTMFPWRFAHTQYRAPVLLQTGELAGPYLLDFVMLWTSAGLAAALGRRRAAGGDRGLPVGALLAPALALAAVLTYGWWRLPIVSAARDQAPALRVAAIQGNVGIDEKGAAGLATRQLDRYEALAAEAAPDAELIIWPETVIQRAVPTTATELLRSGTALGARRPLLTGAHAVDPTAAPPTRYNSAFLLRADGTIVERYDKRVLMPFGEYLPLEDTFPWLRTLSPQTGDFGAGSEPTVLGLDAAAQLGVLICYEDVISWPARELVGAGATLLINLTNDAWYGRSAEPWQHHALALWRAVEYRRDFVRSTNTGLTAVVSATGEALGELPIFTAGVLAADVRLLRGATVYAAYGDVFAWMVVAALALATLRRWRRS